MKYKRTLATNSDGSFRIENGKLVWIDGVEAVKQELETTLRTVRGEDPFDEDHGFPIFDVSGSPPAVVERGVRSALSADDRVGSIDDVDVDDPDTDRKTSVSVQLTLVDGVGLELSTEI